MRPRFLAALLVFAVILLALPQASVAEDKAKAQQLLGEANLLVNKAERFSSTRKFEKAKKAYESALALLNEAYTNFESPRITHGIAEIEEELHLYLDALKHYKEVALALDELDDRYARSVKEGIANMRGKLGGLKLEVEQEDATVVFDGETLGKSPLQETHYFEAGSHTFSVSLEGYTPQEETFDTKRGEVVTRRIDLETMAVVVKPKKKKPVKTAKEPLKKTPMTVSFAVAGAFLIGATFTAIQAKARHDRYQDESVSDMAREAARDRGKSYRLATDVLLGGALVAAGYGTYYYYSKYKPRKKEQALAGVWVSPYANDEGGGVAMGASF